MLLRTPAKLVGAWLLAGLCAGLAVMLDRQATGLLAQSFLLAALVVLVALPIGTSLAVLLARTRLPGRSLLAGVLVAPVLVPLVVQAAAWQSGFGPWGWYSLGSGRAPLLAGWHGAVLVHAMAAVPWVVLIVGAALRLSEPELEEQALLDATAGQTLWRVTLRRTWTAALLAGLTVAVQVLAEMTVTDFFQIRTFAEVVYVELNVEPSAVPLRALNGALIVGCFILVAALWAVSSTAAALQPPQQRLAALPLGVPPGLLTLLVAAGAGLVIGVPLLSLCIKAGVVIDRSATGIERHWSLAKCLAIVATSPWRYRRELGDTLRIALVATLCTLPVAILLADAARRRPWARLFAALLIALLIGLPGPVVGLVVMHVCNRPELPWITWCYDHTVLAPVVVQFARTLPLALALGWHALGSLPRAPLESAAADGASNWRTLWTVAVGQRRGLFAAIGLVVFALAAGELPATILVAPPGVATLPVRIFGLLHAGNEDEVAGICLAIIVGCAGLALLIGRLVARWLRQAA
ncbi:MAG: ABC transporter permease subunit [Pirellulales bacterium]|nr:ABC transporter permease subunit [Pirellulales bacterium]